MSIFLSAGDRLRSLPGSPRLPFFCSALRPTRVKARLALAAEARGGHDDSARPHLGRVLVAGQIALSLVLLVGTGLFLGTLHNLLTLDLGFDRNNVLLVSADLKRAEIPPAQQARAHREIVAKLNGIPGVMSAASSYMAPMGRAGWNGHVVSGGIRSSIAQGRID